MNDQEILNKFTKHLKKVLTVSADVAASLNHQSIEPLHLLYSLSNEKGGLGTSILHKNNLVPEKVRSVLEILNHNLTKNQTITSSLPSLAPVSQKILERAVALAFQNQHYYVGTEHLLYSLITSADKLLSDYLMSQNVDVVNLEKHLKMVLKSTSKFNDLATGENLSVDDVIEQPFGSEEIMEPALNDFAVDLTDKKVQANIDPVIGRENEIDRLIQILSRRSKNNPVLLGDPGTGKTAIVEGLAKRIVLGKVPDILLNKKIWNLDLGSTLAGTMYRGEFEARLKKIMTEVKNNPNIILFIDEIHNLVGAGSSNGSLDAANMLKPALARGQLRLIGATTLEEYKKHIESDPAFERRFQPIIINESSIAEAKEILTGIAKNYEKYHQVIIAPEAITAAVELSARYLPDKFLPDKAIDLIDEAAAKIKVEATKDGLGKIVRNLTDQLSFVERKKEEMIFKEDYEGAAALKLEEDDILRKLADLQKQQDKDKEKILGTVTRSDVASVLGRMTKIPVTELIKEEKEKLLNLENTLAKKIIGQDEALLELAQTLRRARAGLSSADRPLGTFIFLGTSGVGKTETAKVLAEEIFDDPDALIRLDMSEFAEAFNISKLIGAPAGYVGYKESSKLTDAVKRRPYSVILLDEIEKAHNEVFNLLLPVLEDGQLTDAVGKKINFRNTIIIMTSNIGLEDFNRYASLGFSGTTDKKDLNKEMEKEEYEHLKEKINAGLKNAFRPEFLNRLDKVVIFKPLKLKDAEKIAELQLNELAKRFIIQGYQLKFNSAVPKFLANESFSTQEGARGIRRAIQEKVETPLANELLKNSFKAGSTIQIKVSKNKLLFS